MNENESNEQRTILYLLVMNLELRHQLSIALDAYQRCSAETKALILENKKRRKKVDLLFHDLGVWYQAFFDTHDNGKLTLEDYEYIFGKLRRFVAPYVSWWRKQK